MGIDSSVGSHLRERGLPRKSRSSIPDPTRSSQGRGVGAVRPAICTSCRPQRVPPNVRWSRSRGPAWCRLGWLGRHRLLSRPRRIRRGSAALGRSVRAVLSATHCPQRSAVHYRTSSLQAAERREFTDMILPHPRSTPPRSLRQNGTPIHRWWHGTWAEYSVRCAPRAQGVAIPSDIPARSACLPAAGGTPSPRGPSTRQGSRPADRGGGGAARRPHVVMAPDSRSRYPRCHRRSTRIVPSSTWPPPPEPPTARFEFESHARRGDALSPERRLAFEWSVNADSSRDFQLTRPAHLRDVGRPRSARDPLDGVRCSTSVAARAIAAATCPGSHPPHRVVYRRASSPAVL